MRRVINSAIPFVLTLTIGIALDSLLNRFLFRPSVDQSRVVRAWVYEEPVAIVSVPDVEFPKSVQQMGGLWTRVKLRALFDSDGQVKQISAVADGLPSMGFEDGRGQATRQLRTAQRQFMSEILRDVMQTAIDQLSRTKFKPRTVNGEFLPEWVTVETTFAYNFREQGGRAIDVRISGAHVMWTADTWSGRNWIIE
jgi:hypothetical protein